MRTIAARLIHALVAVLGVTVSSLALGDEGIYGPVELRGKEQNDLIDKAAEFHSQFERRGVLYNEPAVLGLVRRIGHELAPEATDSYFDYEFYVVRDPSPNAFALPNGRIYVHTGIIARLDDSSELAALLGHEITHVAGHHSIVQFRIRAGQVLDWIFTGGVVTLFTQLKFSRDLEQESDDRAPVLMLDSEYDPHAAPALMELLAEDFEGVQPRMATIWTTHPDPEDRIQKSLAVVADMPRRGRDTVYFDSIVHPLRAMTIRDYINDDYPYTAIALAEEFIEKYPADLEFRVLLGDAWRQLGPRSEFAPDDFTNRDKRRNLRKRVMRTRVERVAELLETEEGRAALAANLERARDVFDGTLAIDPDYAPAYRGLGEVYEAMDLPREAGRAYVEYVRRAPDADDRPIIMGRLTAIRDRLQQESSDD